MKKYLKFDTIPTLVALAMAFTLPMLALPVAAFGQTYASVSGGTAVSGTATVSGASSVSSSSCVNLTYNLHIGSRDAFTAGQVSMLQSFLRAQVGYTGAVSGYFGPLTFASVVNFQRSHSISGTGFVGPLTRGAIQAASCGQLPGAPVVSALSPASGVIGTAVTITGSGFTADNTVMFDSGAILHVASSNGTTLTFAVPDSLNASCYYSTPRCLLPTRMVMPGNYNVSVQNSNGASNSLVFTVTDVTSVNTPTISSLSPASGQVGTTVTVTGTHFTYDNTIHFSGGVVPHVSSSNNGTTITFVVPDGLNLACSFSNPPCMTFAASQRVVPGNYNVSVENSNGTSNSLTFTVTNGTTVGAPQVTSIWPLSGPVGTSVTITGSGFTGDNNVKFDIGAVTHVAAGNNGTTLTFTVPSYLGYSCAYSNPNCVVPMIAKQVSSGNYNVSVENANGTSNTVVFTVTSATPPPPNAPVISGISGPTQLSVNQTGTWSVTAHDASYGQLAYNITWGDEGAYPNAMAATRFTSPQQISTFNHAYSRAGTYTVTFSVTNNSGLSAQSTMTVNVVGPVVY